MKIFTVNIVLFICFLANAYPQELVVEEDSLSNRNYLITDFNNTVNSANFISRIHYDRDFEKFNIRLKNIYTSNVSKLEKNFFRDINELDLAVNYKLFKAFYAGAGITAQNLSDDKNVELNSNNNNFLFSNFVYLPRPEITVTTRLGYKNENQIGEKNTGPRGSIFSEINSLNLSNYITNAKTDITYENLTQKIHYNYELNADVYKQFTQYSENITYLRLYNRRNDFYFPASAEIKNLFGVNNNIESRVEDLIYAEDRLRYIFSDKFFLTLTGSYYSRNVDRNIKYTTTTSSVILDNNYNSKINENNLYLSAEGEYSTSRLSSRFTVFFSERSETHIPKDLAGYTPSQVRELERIESNKNNSSKRTSIANETEYRYSNTNSFKFSGSSSIFRYDTDSKENFDDRDELYLIGALSHTYNNLTNFKFTTTFDATLSTLSYLFKERSSNNYNNSIYKITANSLYSPIPNLLINSTFQVLANYTVYDFEDIVSQVQSFSYRQMNMRDTIYYYITDKLTLKLYGELKLSEQGEFNDSAFSVKPLAYFDDRNVIGKISYMFFGFAELSIGYKYFQQKRFEYTSGERNLKSTIRNYGPVGWLNLYLTKNSYINFTGGIDYFKYDDSSLDNSSSSLALNILWNI
jgi:hypothetical protein